MHRNYHKNKKALGFFRKPFAVMVAGTGSVLYVRRLNTKRLNKPPYSERHRLSQSIFRQYGKRSSHQFSYSFFKILAWKKLLLVPLLVFWKVFFTEFVTFNDPRLAYSIPIVSLHNHKLPLHKGLLFVGVINGSRKA